MNILRMAGDKLREFDEAYASRVKKDNAWLPLSQMLGGTPLDNVIIENASEAAMSVAEAKRGPASMNQVRRQQTVDGILGYGVLATNAGYRYGLPAAGVTAAAAGIHGLVNQGNTTQGELPMRQ